jgi:hypothetical protein
MARGGGDDNGCGVWGAPPRLDLVAVVALVGRTDVGSVVAEADGRFVARHLWLPDQLPQSGVAAGVT